MHCKLGPNKGSTVHKPYPALRAPLGVGAPATGIDETDPDKQRLLAAGPSSSLWA
jgi:hypothetical protein